MTTATIAPKDPEPPLTCPRCHTPVRVSALARVPLNTGPVAIPLPFCMTCPRFVVQERIAYMTPTTE